jgi:ABC-type phosphate transport system substrate-binding protein
MAQLRRIYTMRQTQWSDAQRITVFVLPRQHLLHIQFSKAYLEMYPYQLDRIWNKLTYSGLGVAPIIVTSPEALIDAVKSTPGAIGYIGKLKDEKGFYVIDVKG